MASPKLFQEGLYFEGHIGVGQRHAFRDSSAGGAGGGSGLTEVIWGSQGGEDTGEELQTDLHLRTVTVSAETQEIHAISI